MNKIADMGGWAGLGLTLAAVLFLNGAGAIATAADAVPADLRQAADAYDQAQMHNSRQALQKLVADDYMLVNSGGQTETKAQFIAESTAPDFRLDPYRVEDEVVRVSRDQAVLGGIVTLSGSDGGRPFRGRLRFSDIWRKRNGEWQVTYTQVTRAAAAAP